MLFKFSLEEVYSIYPALVNMLLTQIVIVN